MLGIAIGVIAGVLFFAQPGFAASDQILRAMYCMSVIDLHLDEDRRIGSRAAAWGVEYYKTIAQQRPLTDEEKHELAEAKSLTQKFRVRRAEWHASGEIGLR